ncbi:hypothetical protein OROGR_023801 [Orobanche gracilis]
MEIPFCMIGQLWCLNFLKPKMLTEAVIESLKEREIQNSHVNQSPVESSNKDDSHTSSEPMETESSLVKYSMPSTVQTTCAESYVCEPLKTAASSLDTSSGNIVDNFSHSDSSDS